jgi:hypothetical protein
VKHGDGAVGPRSDDRGGVALPATRCRSQQESTYSVKAAATADVRIRALANQRPVVQFMVRPELHGRTSACSKMLRASRGHRQQLRLAENNASAPKTMFRVVNRVRQPGRSLNLAVSRRSRGLQSEVLLVAWSCDITSCTYNLPRPDDVSHHPIKPRS